MAVQASSGRSVQAAASFDPSQERKGAPSGANLYSVSSITPAPTSGMVMVDAAALAKLLSAVTVQSSQPSSITLQDGSTYNGEIRDGKPHGKGTLTYTASNPSGYKQYEGDFAGGVPHGEGIMLWRTNAKYDGQWENGVMKGTGTFLEANGTRYNGAMQNNQYQGHGTITTPDSTVYTGQFVRGAAEGQGRSVWHGDVRQGIFKNGVLWNGVYIMQHKPNSPYKIENGKAASPCVIL